jgi:hypothetical protein
MKIKSVPTIVSKRQNDIYRTSILENQLYNKINYQKNNCIT